MSEKCQHLVDSVRLIWPDVPLPAPQLCVSIASEESFSNALLLADRKTRGCKTSGPEHQTLRAWAPCLSSPCVKLRSPPNTHLFLNSSLPHPEEGAELSIFHRASLRTSFPAPSLSSEFKTFRSAKEGSGAPGEEGGGPCHL